MTDSSEVCQERQNNGHYKNGTYLNETEWPLEFIGRSKS
jgi:hypothetical protein